VSELSSTIDNQRQNNSLANPVWVASFARCMAIASFIDPHGHFMSAVRMVEQVNVASPPMGDATDIPTIVEKLEAFQQERSIPEGEWIVG